jgi:hypothetical protein
MIVAGPAHLPVGALVAAGQSFVACLHMMRRRWAK